MKSKRRRGHDETPMGEARALEIYCMLGEGNRSLKKVQQYCIDNDEKPPSWSCMSRWSSRRGWVARAKEYDMKISQKALEITSSTEAEKRVAIAEIAFRAGEAGLNKLCDMIEKLELKGASAADVKALTAASIEVLRYSELIGGTGVPGNKGDEGGDSATPGVIEEADRVEKLLAEHAKNLDKSSVTKH